PARAAGPAPPPPAGLLGRVGGLAPAHPPQQPPQLVPVRQEGVVPARRVAEEAVKGAEGQVLPVAAPTGRALELQLGQLDHLPEVAVPDRPGRLGVPGFAPVNVAGAPSPQVPGLSPPPRPPRPRPCPL